MPGSIIKFPFDPIQGTLLQITEGRMVYTYQFTDKRGSYIMTMPHYGQIENVQMVRVTGESVPVEVEKPTPIFFGFVAKILAEHWSIPKLKTGNWEWIPKSGKMWCRYKESDFMIIERENQRLKAEVLRLRQELGRVPATKPSAEIKPKNG